MTRDEVLAMKPGRELDALAAEKVMGWRECSLEGLRIKMAYGKPADFADDDPRVRIHEYSTDMSAAWEVVEKMRPTHVYELADFGRNKYKNCPHYAAFHPIDKPRDYERQVHAKSLPEAICKASLLAVMDL